MRGGSRTGRDGITRPLEGTDFMVVAPYNIQVRQLRQTLRAAGLANVPVGTVDKFQGREAPVVFDSMATSSAEDVPRTLDFLFSRNRRNVAVLRAMCLACGALRVSEYVDADVFARSLPRSEATAVTAGRAVLRRLDELAMERRSFGFETTLASRSFGPRIRRLIAAGYECHLVFLWLPSADFAVARVADRVRLGVIRYRRRRFSLYQTLTTTWRMYDNSVHQPRLVASGAGRETLVANDVALWRRIRAEAGHEG